MRGKLIGLVLLFTFADLSYQVKETSDYYIGAVVEFEPFYQRKNSVLTLNTNTNSYIKYIKEASQQNADIIVFPEDGITSLHTPYRTDLDSWTTIVPSARDEYVPCVRNEINVTETLKKLSCAAREYHIYVVVNVIEKEPYETQPGHLNGVYYHNTNVVFDRTGKIVARYRKVNLYMESELDRTKIPEIVTFHTDFGVKFGIFTCFDVLFYTPALNLTRIQNVTDIVFTTAWFSEIPFLTSVQAHFGWSFAENVNVLTAGYHEPVLGSSGSGIYLGHNGIANVTMSDEPVHLLISRVPKKSRPTVEKGTGTLHEESVTMSPGTVHVLPDTKNKENTYNWLTLLHDNITIFNSVQINGSTDQHLCYNNFCCDFYVSGNITDSSPTKYRAVVYQGDRHYGNEVEVGVRVCGIIQCSGELPSSCKTINQSDITFNTLNVTAKFDDDHSNILAMPSVLGSSLVPFDGWAYVKSTNGMQTNLSIALTEPTKNLATFGIYIRDFKSDKWNYF